MTQFTTTRTDANPFIHIHIGGSAKLCSVQHAWINLQVHTPPQLSSASLCHCPLVSVLCPSVHWDSGFEGRLVSDVCSSAGPTSQLLRCSPSPPSGKLICSRVLGPSAWTLPFNQHPTSMHLRSFGFFYSCFE